MRTLSSAALRRIAWAVFGLCGVFVAAVILLWALSLIDDGSPSPGADGIDAHVAYLLVVVAFGSTGVVIARRQPRNPIGWLLMSVALLWGFNITANSYAELGVEARWRSLHGAAWLVALGGAAWLGAFGLMTVFVVLLFPDGHLPSRRWRWLPRFSAGVMAFLLVALPTDPDAFESTALEGVPNPAALDAAWLKAGIAAGFALFLVCVLASATSGVVRYRRAVGDERLQLRWLATAAALVAGLLVLTQFVGDVLPGAPGTALGALLNDVLPLCLIPLAIGIAMLRYRLYDIDVVINKAVVFGALAFFITAVYVAIVVGVGRLVGGGDRPNLALSIAATAVVAVAFQPVRDRVQRFANRLVYGVRATPYEVLSEFAARVGGGYGAAELLPTMARTVAQGVGADRVEVWLVSGSGLLREAIWDRRPAGSSDGAATTARDLTELRGDRVMEVRHRGELLGALCVVKPVGESLTPTEERLLDDVAAQAGLVLRNVRLIDELRSSRARLVTTQDEERRRLERNLHDGAQQRLVAVTLMIRTARARLGVEEPTTGAALDRAGEQLQQAIEELRVLARGIHPVILTERGIGPAVQSLAERSPVPVVVETALENRLPAAVEASLYYVVAEALTNVAKYAHATQVQVRLRHSAEGVVLEVVDDGVGGADGSRGSGLRGLADRVAVVDGTLTVESPHGGGTRITCTVPLATLPVRDAAGAGEARDVVPLGASR